MALHPWLQSAHQPLGQASYQLDTAGMEMREEEGKNKTEEENELQEHWEGCSEQKGE